MKKLLLLCLTLAMISCDSKRIESKSVVLQESFGDHTIRVYMIDSCEYIYIFTPKNLLFTHKGNCKYCQLRKK